MILADFKNFKAILKNEKKEIEIRVSSPEQINVKLEEEVIKLRKKYPNYFITLTVNNKYKIDDLDINELSKFKNHINQNLKLLTRVISVEDKKTKNGNIIYNIMCELPGKRRFIKCKMFAKSIITIETGKFYIMNGKLETDTKWIKKNEIALGKKVDYQLNVSSLEKYDYVQAIEADIYSKPRQELHAHTSFSKNDAFITSKDIEKAFIENKIDAMAITDHGAAFAFIPYVNDLKSKFKDSGKRLLLGSEFYTTDFMDYQKIVYEKIDKLNAEKESIENSNSSVNYTIEEIKNEIALLRKDRDSAKKIMNRKSASEQDKIEAEQLYERAVAEIEAKDLEMKEIKSSNKQDDQRIIEIDRELEYLQSQINSTSDAERDHLTVIIASKDEDIDYRGEKLTINPGLVQLYKLISKSYLEYFSTPIDKNMKKYGKRPILPYHELFKDGVRDKFVILSACAFGKHMKLAVEGKWEEFKKWVKKLDAVEIQPTHNNKYMVSHSDYPRINSIEDVHKLHRAIYEACKEVGVPVVFTSDAHVNDKEDRELRAEFKAGYITNIINKSQESRLKKLAKGEEVEEEQVSGDDDFSVETQPYILSYNDATTDLESQGFSEEEIEEIMNNTKMISDRCTNAFEMTVLPKKFFLGEFPGVDVKEEVPKLIWEFALNKWSKDGTIETMDKRISDRLKTEINALQTTGYEILYYIAYWSCRKSEELGYVVGSRGSCGSMLITYCLGVGENNPLDPHYFCPKCKKTEWVETELVGLDLPTKKCECGTEMENDGCAIEAHNFLGYKLDKQADIDLNFSSVVQSEVHRLMKEVFGEENMIKSGTQTFYQDNLLKSNIFKHIPNIKERVEKEDFDIDYLSNYMNVMSTTGAHPGGLLLKPNDIPFEYITPLVYVSDDAKKGEVSSFVDYHSLEESLPKIDALGHSDPTMLKELKELTGFDYKKIKFNDPKMYEAILNPVLLGIEDVSQYPFPSTTMAISEMNSDFTMGVLAEIKPQTMTDMIYFSGVTHGTGSWQGNIVREKVVAGDIKLQDAFPVRDIIFQHLTKKFGFDPAEAFTISESVRKGKGIKKWEKELREKLPSWMLESMEQIKYAFPKAHALSYVTAAMRIYWYKLNYKTEFYASAINRYGIDNADNSSMDFMNMYETLNTVDDLKRFHRWVEHQSDNPTKHKNNQRLANIIYEAKLRGVNLVPASLSSKPREITVDKSKENTLLMPLKSIKGIGDVAAELISIAYSIHGEALNSMDRTQLEAIKVEKNGKMVRAFGKTALDAIYGE